jgi:hypothetical protein
MRVQLRVIVPDLVARLFEELEESNRWPRSMTVKWRLRVSGWLRAGASAQLPGGFRPSAGPEPLVCLSTAVLKLKFLWERS